MQSLAKIVFVVMACEEFKIEINVGELRMVNKYFITEETKILNFDFIL